jgi:hypothetical protein
MFPCAKEWEMNTIRKVKRKKSFFIDKAKIIQAITITNPFQLPAYIVRKNF